MSAVMEVSEGIPTDGRIFETPQISIDNQQPRYVTFLGSLVERQAVIDRPWLKGGGISLANPCLRYVKNFIRKGRITPVLKDTHDYRPADLVKKANEGDSSFFPQVIPKGYVAPTTDGGAPSKHGYMMGKLAYPGEQINAIVNGNANIIANVRRGVVELRSLKGQDYNPQDLGGGLIQDRVIWEIQRAIFPTYPVLPILIEDVGRLLDTARQHATIRDTVDEFAESWQQFREYADTTVKRTHVTMREIAGSSNGYIPTYTAMDLVLLEQLGMARQDEEIRRNANSTIDPEFKDMFMQFLQTSKDEKEARAESERRMAEMFKSQTPQVAGDPGYPGQSGYSGFSGNVEANADYEHQHAQSATGAQGANVSRETPSHVCDCQKSFDTPQGLALHKTRHCELNKKQDATDANVPSESA